MLLLTEAATHLPLAAVALPACWCGQPREPWLRRQGGLPRSLLLFWEAPLRQVLLPSGQRLGLQELSGVDSLAGRLVQCVGLAGWAQGIRCCDVVWTRGWTLEGSVQLLEWAAAPAHKDLLPQEPHAPAAVQAEQLKVGSTPQVMQG